MSNKFNQDIGLRGNYFPMKRQIGFNTIYPFKIQIDILKLSLLLTQVIFFLQILQLVWWSEKNKWTKISSLWLITKSLYLRKGDLAKYGEGICIYLSL